MRQNYIHRVVTSWMLEHVSDSGSVFREGLRVLRPEGMLICTEVDNSTFSFDPPQDAIDTWWASFNRLQSQADKPFIGNRLADIASESGGSSVDKY